MDALLQSPPHPLSNRRHTHQQAEQPAWTSQLVGVSETTDFSFINALQDTVHAAHDLPQAITTFIRATTPHLAGAVAQWRTRHPQPQPLEAFGTVVLGGLQQGVPTFREISAAERGPSLTWEHSDPIRCEPKDTYVGLYGALAPEAVRRTSWWTLRWLQEQTLDGVPVGAPVTGPVADADGAAVRDFLTEMARDGIADQARAPRPADWPANAPVAAGAPVFVGLQFHPRFGAMSR